MTGGTLPSPYGVEAGTRGVGIALSKDRLKESLPLSELLLREGSTIYIETQPNPQF